MRYVKAKPYEIDHALASAMIVDVDSLQAVVISSRVFLASDIKEDTMP